MAYVTQSEKSEPDLRLPDHRQELRQAPALVRVLGAAASAVGVAIVAVVYLVGAPIIAFFTGLWQILMEVRDNAVRPRPFVGAHHGLPFLDPPVVVPPPDPTDQEE